MQNTFIPGIWGYARAKLGLSPYARAKLVSYLKQNQNLDVLNQVLLNTRILILVTIKLSTTYLT